MMGRFARPSIVIVALQISWIGSVPSGAQQPAPTPPRVAIPPPRTFWFASTSTAPPAPVAPVRIPPPRPFGQPGSSITTSPIATDARDMALKLQPAPLASDDLGFPINLATALRLSDARPLIVAAAQASVWVAEAQLKRANVLWVPSLMLGFDYTRHDGGGPDFNKGIMTAVSANFFYGGGGLYQMVNLTDAIFQPLAARQMLNSRRADIQTAKNDALLATAEAYFKVHQYRGMYAGLLFTVEKGHEVVDRITKLSKDLVRPIEIERGKTLLADLEQEATSAREAWRIHSADLTQVLRLDPRAVVVPLEHDHLQITLIDPAVPLHDLMPIALANRPELASRRALVEAADATVRREKMRPLLPVVMINGFQSPSMYLQAGIFGIGPNSSLNQWVGRSDVSYQLIWQLEAFGIGNLARIKQQRGLQSQSIIDLNKTQDRVAAEVTQALARLQSSTARVEQADRALRTAITAFNGNYEGLQQTTRFGDELTPVFRPQEVIYALRLMKVAFDEYFKTVAEYNLAQFQLFHALGYPAQELAVLRPPGDILPVDTTRPNYLPPVGNGPPPATR